MNDTQSRHFFIRRNDIYNKFKENVEFSDAIDIATGWISFFDGVELLREFADKDNNNLRIVFGLKNDISTNPAALRNLMYSKNARLFLKKQEYGMFHSKLYIFKNKASNKTIIGSANLTSGGFYWNTESVMQIENCEISDSEFARLIYGGNKITIKYLVSHIKDFNEQLFMRRNHDGKDKKSQKISKKEEITGGIKNINFDDYYCFFKNYDEKYYQEFKKFLIFRGCTSYFDLFDNFDYILGKSTWEYFGEFEKRVILGIKEPPCYICEDKTDKNTQVTGWDLLGSVKKNKEATKIFSSCKPKYINIRKNIHHLLKIFRNSEANICEISDKIYRELRTIDGIKRATASRLMALTRPDICTIINGITADPLSEMMKIDKDLLESECGMKKLVEFFHGHTWTQIDKPADHSDYSKTWKRRCALLHVVLSKPMTGKTDNQPDAAADE